MRLTHLDRAGRARMVDVGPKPETAREAVACAAVRMARATLQAVERSARGGEGPRGKGDVFATARIAGLAAMKKAADLIPLCHPVRLTGGAVELEADDTLPGVQIRVTARAFDRTGVEMEAMLGASAAALTVYDMVKGLERGVEILNVRLDEKRGGRSGLWQRSKTMTPERRRRQKPAERRGGSAGRQSAASGSAGLDPEGGRGAQPATMLAGRRLPQRPSATGAATRAAKPPVSPPRKRGGIRTHRN